MSDGAFYSRLLPHRLTRKMTTGQSLSQTYTNVWDSTERENAKEKPSCAKLIVSIDEETGKIDLQTDVLKSILCCERVKNIKVAIVSIAGPYRKGKSFLLSFFVRYFSHERQPNWLEVNVDAPLEGFHWSRGAEPDTKGIWMWSEPLIVGDVAIFLMDVQGSFDAKQSDQANTNVLAWSTMISTVTIFNLMSDLQKNYLDNLNYCTEYARIAVRNQNENPFQKLIFLIRDWERISSHPFGFRGGHEYLTKWFADNNKEQISTENSENQISTENNENQTCTENNAKQNSIDNNLNQKSTGNNLNEKSTDNNLNQKSTGNKENSKRATEPERNSIQNLNSAFRQLQCFLMPHPGNNVWLFANFKGELFLLDTLFLYHLNEFVPNVIDNIGVNASLRTGPELFAFIDGYFKAVSDAEMPTAESHFNLQVKSDNIKAIELAQIKYDELMEKCGKESKPVWTDWFKSVFEFTEFNGDHEKACRETTEYFLSLPKLDLNRNNREYLRKLTDDLNRRGGHKFNENRENDVRKKSRLLGKMSMGTGAAVSACAGVYALTTVAGALCAATGVGGLVLIGVGGVFWIASERKQIWGLATKMFSNTEAKFQQAENNFASTDQINSLINNFDDPPPAYSEIDSSPAHKGSDSPPVDKLNEALESFGLAPRARTKGLSAAEKGAGNPVVRSIDQICVTSGDKTQTILIFVLLVIIICLLVPLPVGVFVSALIAPLFYYATKF